MTDTDNTAPPQNQLAQASSAYLRTASHQPVAWQAWGPEAFARARREQKPILLDIGAVWCHWCHVMDRESYENADTAAILNEHYVAIKVDRDERPDVDSRYQAAVQAMAGQGGWPLTVILTPEGQPFFGGTYFPPEERYGRPSFGRLLQSLAEVWQSRRAEAEQTAASVMKAIEGGERFAGRSGSLSPAIVQKLVAGIVAQFDPHHGGFGAQPKFPHPAALDLLLDAATRSSHEQAKQVIAVTLRSMASGGVYDQIAGGFHRYSVDAEWHVPHFEKMLYDNAGLLANYVHAYQSLDAPEFAGVAKDILRWMDSTLSDRERGGFYASQDADINLDDDGDYFTWTLEELGAVLSAEERAVIVPFYGAAAIGPMHHDPTKNVLRCLRPLTEVAEQAHLSLEVAAERLQSAKAKLLAARAERPTPYIDKTIYTGWNGLAIGAYLEASRVLALPAVKDFALRSLDRILKEAWQPQPETSRFALAHIVAYGESAAQGAGTETRSVPGMLEDYAFVAAACLTAWEVTAEIGYYEAALALSEAMIDRFYDPTGGGFFDSEQDDHALGALTARRKPLQDSPTPAGNPAAAAVLIRLAHLSGQARYQELAEDTLEAFAGVADQYGLYGGMYGLALQSLLAPARQIVVVGSGPEAEALQRAALSGYCVGRTVVAVDQKAVDSASFPPVLAETLPNLAANSSKTESRPAFALLCTGTSCQPPIYSPEQMQAALEESGSRSIG